jgi:hypothetical protein
MNAGVRTNPRCDENLSNCEAGASCPLPKRFIDLPHTCGRKRPVHLGMCPQRRFDRLQNGRAGQLDLSP